MTGGENQAQREPGLAFRQQPATSPAPPPPAPVRRASGVTTTDDFVIDHLHKLELAGGPGVATRLADSAHLQVIRPPPPSISLHLLPPTSTLSSVVRPKLQSVSHLFGEQQQRGDKSLTVISRQLSPIIIISVITISQYHLRYDLIDIDEITWWSLYSSSLPPCILHSTQYLQSGLLSFHIDI